MFSNGRVLSTQALNWLLHEVSRASCLHDLLWWFVIALSAEVRTADGTAAAAAAAADSTDPRCRHPLSDLYLAGESVSPLPQVFYAFLQTVSDLMLYLPPGSALQMMAVRCWDISFTAADHMFLHRYASLPTGAPRHTCPVHRTYIHRHCGLPVCVFRSFRFLQLVTV